MLERSSSLRRVPKKNPLRERSWRCASQRAFADKSLSRDLLRCGNRHPAYPERKIEVVEKPAKASRTGGGLQPVIAVFCVGKKWYGGRDIQASFTCKVRW